MRNSNIALKEVLNQKVAEQAVSIPSNNIQAVSVQPIAVLPPMTVTISLNFSLPLDGAQLPLERIQALVKTITGQVGAGSSVRPVVLLPTATRAPVTSCTPVQAVSQESSNSRMQTPVNVRKATPATTAATPMTEKQRALILSMTARKKLSAEAVESILQREFGHADGAALSKRDASRLIDHLMSL